MSRGCKKISSHGRQQRKRRSFGRSFRFMICLRISRFSFRSLASFSKMLPVLLNNFSPFAFQPHMKTILCSVLFASALVGISPAQSCREVVRDASGRVVQTIDRQKQFSNTERAVIRDASGRVTGTATTRPSYGSNTRTEYRDASGRLTGSATTNSTFSNASSTTFRDSSGRVTGSAHTNQRSNSSSYTQYRDASGRLTGTQSSTSGTNSSTYRDAQGRVISKSTASGKCNKGTGLLIGGR
jgi:YD repeat-containing protein